MLTGDKLETAENIAKSCNLFERDMQIMPINKKSDEELEKQMNEIVEIV